MIAFLDNLPANIGSYI